jgi:hypothetical protein
MTTITIGETLGGITKVCVSPRVVIIVKFNYSTLWVNISQLYLVIPEFLSPTEQVYSEH